MPDQFTLGKNERLKSRKQIDQLFKEGKHFAVNPFRVYFFINRSSTTENRIKFGVGVSNKNFKRAVDRNRIKRLTREAWRLEKNELEEKLKSGNQQLNVFFIYTNNVLPVFSQVKVKVAVALKNLSDKTDENIS